jgi:hypothetical protein
VAVPGQVGCRLPTGRIPASASVRPSRPTKATDQAVAALPHVRQAQRLFGDPDYLLRVIAADLPAFQQLYDDRLATLPGVQRLTSTLVIEERRRKPSPPTLRQDRAEQTPLDRRPGPEPKPRESAISTCHKGTALRAVAGENLTGVAGQRHRRGMNELLVGHAAYQQSNKISPRSATDLARSASVTIASISTHGLTAANRDRPGLRLALTSPSTSTAVLPDGLTT